MPNPLPLLFAVSALVAVTACASRGHVTVVNSPYADGAMYTEPVFYNDKHYDVSFRYNTGINAYDVTVAGRKGRRLSDKAGDQAIVEQIAASAVTHFACANGQKSTVVPGSSHHADGRWTMQTRCV